MNTSFYVSCKWCREKIAIADMNRAERKKALDLKQEYICHICERAEELRTEDSTVNESMYA